MIDGAPVAALDANFHGVCPHHGGVDHGSGEWL